MSKQVSIQATCPDCGAAFRASVWRVIWAETPGNRERVFDDSINVLLCPRCGFEARAPMALMYVDKDRNFAVWFEPHRDTMIDEEIPQYARMFGKNCYYVTAPRVPDWEAFKDTIVKFERGELKGGPLSTGGMMEGMRALTAQKRTAKQGCLSPIATGALLLAACGTLWVLLR